MTLPQQIQDWVQRQIGPIRTAVRLKSATSTSVYRLAFADQQTLILRVYDNNAWMVDEPDLPQHERAALNHAAGMALPVPRVIASDPDGTVCGIPVLLMSYLPGDVVLVPEDMDTWLAALAAGAAAVHQVDVGDFGWRYFPYHRLDALTVPEWTPNPANWQRAIDVLRAGPPELPVSFIHRDYHPMNLLWQDGQISGVVDWINACVGPAPVDSAHCRVNLAQMYGVEAAERFLAAYRAAGGVHHPYYDLAAVMDFGPGAVTIYPPWLDHGLDYLTDELCTWRVELFLEFVLARL
ncbi:MAG: phosphotransferase family protein [Chloroflexota bacterium]